jgi:hypothetical protein
MSSARGIRTRTSCGLSAVTPASWSRAPRERIPGIGPGSSPRQGDALPLRHIRVEPPAGTDPATSSVPRTCSAIELRRHELEEVDSNHHCRGQGPADCRYLTLHGSRRRVLPPAGHPYKGRPVVGPSGHVPPVRLELTLPGPSCRCLLPLGYEGSEPPPGADPGHPLYESGAAAVRGGKAARRGFEPRPPRPERGVLPVRRTGIGTGGAIRTRTGQDLSLLSAAIGLRPRAPPGSRSPFSGLRVQCITRHACGAQSG